MNNKTSNYDTNRRLSHFSWIRNFAALSSPPFFLFSFIQLFHIPTISYTPFRLPWLLLLPLPIFVFVPPLTPPPPSFSPSLLTPSLIRFLYFFLSHFPQVSLFTASWHLLFSSISALTSWPALPVSLSLRIFKLRLIFTFSLTPHPSIFSSPFPFTTRHAFPPSLFPLSPFPFWLPFLPHIGWIKLSSRMIKF